MDRSGVATPRILPWVEVLEDGSPHGQADLVLIFLRLLAAIWRCHSGAFSTLPCSDGGGRSSDDGPRVEQLNEGPPQHIYFSFGVLHVSMTLLFTGNQYDIIYP